MSLAATYTISASPITVDDDPNTTEPASARKFSPPTISVGPSQLWIYRKDGSGTFIVELWFFDDANDVWVLLVSANLASPKTLTVLPFDFGITAKLFVRVAAAGGADTTKCAYGFGVGSVSA